MNDYDRINCPSYTTTGPVNVTIDPTLFAILVVVRRMSLVGGVGGVLIIGVWGVNPATWKFC